MNDTSPCGVCVEGGCNLLHQLLLFAWAVKSAAPCSLVWLKEFFSAAPSSHRELPLQNGELKETRNGACFLSQL